jgi:quinol monooxygenase YgiN
MNPFDGGSQRCGFRRGRFRWRKRIGRGYLDVAAPGMWQKQREVTMIRVVAVITANPGRRDEILAAFRANVPAVRAEKGCIEYEAHVDATGIGPFQAKFGPDIFAVIETWESPEALAAHIAAPHMAAYGKKTRDLIANRAVHVLSAID